MVDRIDAVARRYEAVGPTAAEAPSRDTVCQPCGGGAPIWMYTRRQCAEGIPGPAARWPSRTSSRRTTDQVLTRLPLFDYLARRAVMMDVGGEFV